MRSKDGFLLIELMIGLSLSIFFIVIIVHYIIEVKAAQQKALKRIENFSSLRNIAEKALIKNIPVPTIKTKVGNMYAQ